MRVKIFTKRAGQLEWEDMEDSSILALTDSLEDEVQDPDDWLIFEMDGATVRVRRSELIRIDIETGVTDE